MKNHWKFLLVPLVVLTAIFCLHVLTKTRYETIDGSLGPTTASTPAPASSGPNASKSNASEPTANTATSPTAQNDNCPPCPVCPLTGSPASAVASNFALLSKYLTLIIKKNEAQDEIFHLAQGYARVYTSPKLELINRQISDMRKRVHADPSLQKFFEDNLDANVLMQN